MTLTALFSPDWDSRPAPETAVLLLHGYGSNERDLPGIVPQLGVDAPMASLRAPVDMGGGAYGWFPLDAELRFEPDPIAVATDALWEWVDENVAADTRLVLVGFSQGGFMATQLMRTRPERIADTIIFSGFVFPLPQPADAVLAAERPRVFWGRGMDDMVIPPELVGTAASWLREHTTLTEKVYPGMGHSVNDQELADVRAHLAQAPV